MYYKTKCTNTSLVINLLKVLVTHLLYIYMILLHGKTTCSYVYGTLANYIKLWRFCMYHIVQMFGRGHIILFNQLFYEKAYICCTHFFMDQHYI